MKTSSNNKGFTLIELVIVLAILGITIASVFSLLFFGKNTFKSGTLQQSLQTDNRYFAEFIEKELTYASKVEILPDKPINFLNTRRYIYSENGVIMHKIPNKDPKPVLTSDNNIDSEIMFNSISNTVFSYDIESKSKKQKYNLSSQIDILNIQGERIDDRIEGEKGSVLSYAFSLNSKELIYFKFEESENKPVLKSDIEGRVVGDEVILYVPINTDVTKLKSNFSTTGVEVSIAGIVQTSNEIANDYTNIVKLEVRAEDGSIKEYKIRVEILSDTPPAVQNVRINPKDPNPNKNPEDWEITTIAWDTSHLFVNEYLFISNGNGSDKSTFKWYISDTKDGTYTEIVNQTLNKFVPNDSHVDKWIKLGVVPRGDNGNTGVEVFANPVEINKDPKNALWKRIVEDLNYVYMTEKRKEEFDKDRADKGLEPYVVIVKIRDDILNNKTNPIKITADVKELSLKIEGSNKGIGSNYGSLVSIDLEKFMSKDDFDGYQLRVDAKIISGAGWGLMANGTVDNNNKDSGYMFQFDPGYNSGGFVIRRFFDGNHNPFDGLGVNKYYSHGNLFNSKFENNKPTGWQGYYSDYTTEITTQKQLDNSMIMRVRIWRKGYPDNISNEMWYGDFGENTLDYAFQGVKPEGDRQPTLSNSTYKGLVRLNHRKDGKDWDWGTMLGLRTWINTDKNFDVQFNNITIDKGFSMNIKSAKFLVDNFGKSNESSNKLLLTFDQDLRNDFKVDKIIFNSKLGTIKSIKLAPKDNKSIIITFNSNISNVNEIIDGNKINRGAVRQSKAGDIKIINGDNFKVEGKVDASIYRRFYKITNKGTLKVLDVSGGTSNGGESIIHWPQNNPLSDNQMWELIEIETGVYNIVSKLSGMALEANSSSNNSVITQRPINLSEGKQKWILEQTGNDFWIKLKGNNNIRIEATGTQDISLRNIRNNNAQKWIIEEINN